MQVLLENRWQAKKVRWVAWGMVVWAIGWVYWAWTVAQTYGLSPGDGGVLRPVIERAAFAALIAAIGLLPIGCMLVYLRLYLTRIERDGEIVQLTVLGLLASSQRRFHVSDFQTVNRHEGRMQLRSSVHAPWLTVRVAGRRLPFLVDLQSERILAGPIAALAKPKSKTTPKLKRGRRDK